MILLKPVVLLLRLLATIAFVSVLVVLGLAVLPLFQGAGSYPWVAEVMSWDAALIQQVRATLPTRIGQLDMARPFLALVFLFGAAAIDAAATKLSAVVSPGAKRKRLAKRIWARQPKGSRTRAKTGAPTPVPETSTSEKRSREDLVRQMVEAKRELDAMSKDVAFLALDVVESTNMKLGEDPAFVEHDFREFKTMVEAEVFRGLLKSAWTPDGAMMCFDSLERAIRAAQDMLRQLPVFNADTRMMGTPFRVRCGVNSGRVPYDPDTPMEAMSHNVIDVAGHMQKYADPDTIYIAGDLVRQKAEKLGFDPADTEVDGHEVYVWRGPSADRTGVPG
ncbi:MAG: guanylate cyclase [Gemmatimonadetes bacterium]|nr:guanylate cyclase [Gemmatimonadota bacterium]